jgi:ankyrin repeat protein
VIFKADMAMMKLLLDHGADVESPTSDGKTALMMAAMFNNIPAIELLISRGANPLRADDSGTTALQVAQRMGATQAAEALAGKA